VRHRFVTLSGSIVQPRLVPFARAKKILAAAKIRESRFKLEPQS